MVQYLHIKTGSWNVKIISMNQSISMLMLKCIFPRLAVADDVFNSTKRMYLLSTYISCCYCAWNVKWAYTNGGQCFYRVIFPPRNETVQELYLDKCNFIYRRLSRGRRLKNCADSPRISPCPRCGGLAVSCAARCGEQRGSGQSVGGSAGGDTVHRGRGEHSEHGAAPRNRHYPPG